ncbi:MAG: DUF2723 domain-containing protein [Bacteroidetes bacterium]|nr:DUF2723 domain-containing protein [Bacteroidota bacterium]
MTDIRRRRLLASAIVFAVSLLLYLFTLAPSMDFIDAGELAAVAHTWGIAHPTGYPLFTLLAGLWALLPFGSGMLRMNIFAAVFSAAGAAVAVQLIFDLLRALPDVARRRNAGKKKAAAQATVPAEDDDTLLRAAASGALVLAFGGTFWRTALSIEVYSLHILMLALVLWSAARLFFLPVPDVRSLQRRMAVTAFLLGLSFSNHMSTVFLLPALLVMLFLTHARSEGFGKGFAFAAAAFALGLLPYLYLPLRAAAGPALNWGNPVDFERLFWHVSGKQYSVWMFSGAQAWGKQFMYALEAFARDSAWLALLPAAIGAVVASRRRRSLGVFLLLLFVTCLVWAAGYDINDIDSYFLLGFFVLAIWTAFGLRILPQLRVLRGVPPRLRDPLVPGAVVLAVLLLLQWGRVSQAGNYLVEDYTHNMFASLEKDAVVLSFQWDFWISASYYYQLVENKRPDIVVLDKELFRRSWYFEQLRSNHPDIHASVRAEIETFLVHLRRFERGEPYDPAAIEDAFNAVVNGIVDRAYATRPVYVTIELEKQFAPGYVRVPAGLAFRLYRPEDLPDPASTKDVPLVYRPFDSDDRLPVEMRRLYASMFGNRGIYLADAGLRERAERALQRALEFSPGDPAILDLLRRLAGAP